MQTLSDRTAAQIIFQDLAKEHLNSLDDAFTPEEWEVVYHGGKFYDKVFEDTAPFSVGDPTHCWGTYATAIRETVGLNNLTYKDVNVTKILTRFKEAIPAPKKSMDVLVIDADNKDKWENKNVVTDILVLATDITLASIKAKALFSLFNCSLKSGPIEISHYVVADFDCVDVKSFSVKPFAKGYYRERSVVTGMLPGMVRSSSDLIVIHYNDNESEKAITYFGDPTKVVEDLVQLLGIKLAAPKTKDVAVEKDVNVVDSEGEEVHSTVLAKLTDDEMIKLENLNNGQLNTLFCELGLVVDDKIGKEKKLAQIKSLLESQMIGPNIIETVASALAKM